MSKRTTTKTAASNEGPSDHEAVAPSPEPTAKKAAQVPTRPPKGKIGAVVALLRAPEGATIEGMMAETGWQAHSVRGAMSGSIKKALGLTIASEKIDGVRTYRIVETAQA